MAQALLGLEVHTAKGESRRLRFDAGPVTIGRDADNQVVLEGPHCSPRHATIEWGDHGWMLIDTSAHGTDYNGVELRWGERVRLSHGDLLKVGDAELLVTIEGGDTVVGEAAPSPAPIPSPASVPPPAPPSSPSSPTTRAPASALERLMGSASSATTPPRLHFFHSGDYVRELPLAEEGVSILIGRDPACEIVVADPFRVVSKRHARAYRTWGGVFLEDLSQHGVYLNGERVQNIVALTHGDRITLSTVAQGSWGPVLIYLEASEAAHAAEAAAFAASRARNAPAAVDAPRTEPARVEAAPNDPPRFEAVLNEAAQSEAGRTGRSRPRALSMKKPSDSSFLVYVALGVAGLAVIGLVIGTLLFFGKP